MFHADLVRGPERLSGAINVELGTVAVVLRKNQVQDVLGPGRYSRARLAMLGITPLTLSVIYIRTAMSRYTADCLNVLMGESRVDLRVVVQVRLRLDGDLKRFFTDLMGSYGTDFGSQAPLIIQQLIEEGLQETGATRNDSARQVRKTLGSLMEPGEIFEILDVISLTVTRDDPISLQAEVEGRLRPLERARRLADVQLAADEGQLRATAAIQLSQRLGVDPLYLWDPEGYRADTESQRQTLVQLVGQYGENLAILAEATNMNTDVLGALLRPVLPSRAALPNSPALAGPSGSRLALPEAALQIDDAVARIAGLHGVAISGGIFRSCQVAGKSLSIALAVAPEEDIAEVELAMSEEYGPGAIVKVFSSRLPPEDLARNSASWLMGRPLDSIMLTRSSGQILWEVSSDMLADEPLAEFVVETICDLFISPVLLPVVVGE